jgi:hypothetical protein
MKADIQVPATVEAIGQKSHEELGRQARSRAASTPHRLPGIARLAVTLEILLGVGAFFGGGLLILAPDGHLLGVPLTMLAGTPFRSFLVPGTLLFTFVGVVPFVAAAITARRWAIAPLSAVAVGMILMGWITVEMVILAGPTSLFWAVYLVLGTVIAASGVVWLRQAR